LALLLPYSSFKQGESPFVTFSSSIGVNAAAPILELVVITAAMSSLNAGLYSPGRILHSMSMAASAPKFAQRMNSHGVPYGGFLITSAVSLSGGVRNFRGPGQAFGVVLDIASFGVIGALGHPAPPPIMFAAL
ncbi:hypothetical protein ACVB9L_10865, partial [Rothia kristinae]